MRKILSILFSFACLNTCAQFTTPAQVGFTKPSAAASCPTNANAGTYLTAIGNTDPTFCTAVDNFFVGLVNNSLYSKVKRLNFLTTGSSSTAIVNAVSPGTNNSTSNGTITYASTGATGNGSTGYINMNLNPTNDFTTTSGMIGAYIRTNISETSYDMGGDDNLSLTVKPVVLVTRYLATGGTAYATYGNGSYATSAASASSIGFWATNRDGGVTYLYKDGTSLASTTESASLPNLNIYAMCVNGGGTAAFFSTKEFCLLIAMDGLTGTEMGNLNTLVQAFKTTMGL